MNGGNDDNAPLKNGDSLSGEDWMKELAEMKGEIDEDAEIPDRPVRLPTPPPGGFKVPELPPNRKETKASDAGGDFDFELPGEEAGDEYEEEEEYEEEAEEELEEEEEEFEDEEDDLPSSTRGASVTRREIETALGSSIGTSRPPSSRYIIRKPEPGAAGLLLSVLLFFGLAFAILAGYYFRSREGVEYYIARLGNEDTAVQMHARDSLSFMGNLAVGRLADVIECEDTRQAIAAVDTLALIETDESVKVLMSLTTHPNDKIRKRALTALGEKGAPRAFSNIEHQIYSEDHDTRLCAIAALENFDAGKSVPILLELLEDEDWRIRNEAAKSLQVISGENIGAPKSTYSEKMNEIIRLKWREWWESEGAKLKEPVKEGD